MTLTAFRMTLKDLLAIYSAINEGVINLLGERMRLSAWPGRNTSFSTSEKSSI